MGYHVIGFSKALKDVFGTDSADMHGHMVRMFALYEDLRIEVRGFEETSLGRTDENGVEYRRKYFFRRSVATLDEFGKAIAALDECADFRSIKEMLAPEDSVAWQETTQYFASNEWPIRRHRNDFAAHFGQETGIYLVNNLYRSAADTRVEIHQEGQRESYRFRFVNELTALALMKQKPESQDLAAYFSTLYELIIEGWQWATTAVHIVWGRYVMPKIFPLR